MSVRQRAGRRHQNQSRELVHNFVQSVTSPQSGYVLVFFRINLNNLNPRLPVQNGVQELRVTLGVRKTLFLNILT